jgi:hypothetical protein
MVKTQDDGAAAALERLSGEPERQAAHTARVNAELARSLRNAAGGAREQERKAARGRSATEAAAIRRHELMR